MTSRRRLLVAPVALTLLFACGDDSGGSPPGGAVCGDGVLAAGEGCDDGNGILTDACPDGDGGTCQPAACGDGFIFAGSEACDDGPLNSDSAPGACRSTCSYGVCGDGVVDLLEACDDGNGILTDNCPDGPNGTCELAACGDGFIQTGLETCDDGGANSDTAADACRTSCVPASCGDGVTDTDESCDDGNQENGDACPDGANGSCAAAYCGDGFVLIGSETCDDGANNSNTTPDACRAHCQPAFCGDGVVDSVESCDDGGLNSDTTPDACRTTCVAAYCGDGVADSTDACDLELVNRNQYPTRVTEAPDGRVLVTDARAHSLFIYEADLTLVAELKNLGTPLGVTVSGDGILYIGSNDNDRVERYSLLGEHLGTVGEGMLEMPTDLDIDADGNLYVADSMLNLVKVYAPDGSFLRDIGCACDGSDPVEIDELLFPVAVEVGYRSAAPNGELFVADQRHSRVVVFALDGTPLRTLGGPRIYDDEWQGLFAKVQSLQMDAYGRLHTLDSQIAVAQILDADTGTYLGHYGQLGTGPGDLNTPLDIWITEANEVVVANNANHRIEIIYVIP